MQQHTPLPEDLTTLAIDLAKDTFQIAGENQQQRIKGRATFARLLKQIPTHITVLMETGAGAQHYARTLQTQGNPVRILLAFHVSRHRHGGKNDRNDTLVILRAARDQSIHPVPIKTPEQSALLTLHNIRLANHNLRIIWRLLTDDLDYQRNHRTPRPIDTTEPAPQQTSGETGKPNAA